MLQCVHRARVAPGTGDERNLASIVDALRLRAPLRKTFGSDSAMVACRRQGFGTRVGDLGILVWDLSLRVQRFQGLGDVVVASSVRCWAFQVSGVRL